MDAQDGSISADPEPPAFIGALGAQESQSQGLTDILPEEILVQIFKLVVEPNPPVIGRLLMVSRYWRCIVRMTPSLWSRIVVRPRNLRNAYRINGIIHYVEMAYANSANLPLEIMLDFKYLSYPSLSIEVPTTVLKFLMSTPTRPHSHIAAVGGIPVLCALLQAVLGRNGVNAARWKSLRLEIPGNYAEDLVLDCLLQEFRYPIPNLESLAFHCRSSYKNNLQRVMGLIENPRSQKSLTLNENDRLEGLKLAAESVRTLHFRQSGPIRVIHPFKNLVNLSILSLLEGGISYASDTTLAFPVLDCFTLKCPRYQARPPDSQGTLSQRIRAPMLTTLRLLDDGALSNVAGEDAFCHIHTLDLLVAPTTRLESFIDLNLAKYTKLTTLTICPWHLETVRTSLRGLKFRGEAPVGLNMLYSVFMDKGDVLLHWLNFETVVTPCRLPNEFVYRIHALSTCTIQ